MSATKSTDANVAFFNAAVLYQLRSIQSVADDELIVKYPDNMYINYQDFIDNNCEPNIVDKKKNKAFSADAVAAAAIEDIFNKVVDDIKTAQEDEKDLTLVSDFAKERPGALTILKSMAKLSRPEDFNSDMKGKVTKNVTQHVKRKCKVTGRGRFSVTDALKSDVAEKFMTWMFHAAKYVAIALIFNKTTTVSKYSDNAINVAFWSAAQDAGASLTDLYTLANSCDAWQVVTKVIVKKTPGAKGDDDKPKKGGKGTKKKVAEVSDDEEDDDDVKPVKKAGKKTAKKAADSDDEEEEKPSKKSGKKKAAVDSDEEDDEEEAPTPKKGSKKASKIDADEEDEEEADEE